MFIVKFAPASRPRYQYFHCHTILYLILVVLLQYRGEVNEKTEKTSQPSFIVVEILIGLVKA